MRVTLGMCNDHFMDDLNVGACNDCTGISDEKAARLSPNNVKLMEQLSLFLGTTLCNEYES